MSKTLRTPWRVEPTDRWPGLFSVYDCDGNVIAAAKTEEVARLIANAPVLMALLQINAPGVLEVLREQHGVIA